MQRQQPTLEQKQEYLSKCNHPPNYSEYDLLCFLIGHNCNVDLAVQALENTVERITALNLPSLEDKETFASLDSACKLYWLPFPARDQRPVLVWKSKNHTPLKDEAESELSSKWLIFNMWRAIQSKVLTEKLYVLIDRADSDFKSFDNKLFTIVNSTFATLFPERNAKTFVAPTGMILRGIWSAVRPFMDVVTASKICFLADPKDAMKDLYEDLTNVPLEYGGLLEMTDYGARATFEVLRRNVQ